jgi:3',5'-cyclic-AMP phosphodiesterase
MKIVQISDTHVGDVLFRPALLLSVIEETNELEPDLVVVAGDLTAEGYRWEFEEAKGYLDRIECPNVVMAMGNHDAMNAGYRHFEKLFGMRERAVTVSTPEGEVAKVVVLDSSKPDLDDGEVGREHYAWLDSEFRDRTRGPKILVLHHHMMAVPSTGRDVDILLDAGEVMAILRELKVDMVLAGHRHVPYVWSISGVRVVHSGTASSWRVTGVMPPSYNVIELGSQEIKITLREPGKGEGEPLASFSRTPVATSKFFPDFDQFVTYGKLPFLRRTTDEPSSGALGDAPPEAQ